jgi:hypothetical protein
MTNPIRTWKDVLAERQELSKKLLEPLPQTDKQILDFLLTKERENLYLTQPQIVTPLLTFLEEHIS